MARPLRALVAIDFSPQSRAALRAARALLRNIDGHVTLVHVRPFSDVRAAVLEERGDLLRLGPGGVASRLAEHFESRFEKIARRGSNESVRLLRGEPAREICREARRGYDLLFMGTRGRGKAAVFFLGSTVQEVLVRSPIPLVVVPESRRP